MKEVYGVDKDHHRKSTEMLTFQVLVLGPLLEWSEDLFFVCG